jgi:hypothetical protein
MECLRHIIETCPLARSLNQLYNAIHQMKQQPANPLYAHLPTTLTINVAYMPVDITVAPRAPEADEAWAHWGEKEDATMSDDGQSDTWSEGLVTHPNGALMVVQAELKVDPWQTLLLLESEEAAAGHRGVSTDLMGLGIHDAADPEEESIVSPKASASRRGSDSDEAVLMSNLIAACDVSRP